MARVRVEGQRERLERPSDDASFGQTEAGVGVTQGVARLALGIVNAYLIGEAGGPWVLLDAGTMAVCDAVCRPDRETPIVRDACKRGTRAVTGERMLLYRGVQAQGLWTEREPNVNAMDGAISWLVNSTRRILDEGVSR